MKSPMLTTLRSKQGSKLRSSRRSKTRVQKPGTLKQTMLIAAAVSLVLLGSVAMMVRAADEKKSPVGKPALTVNTVKPQTSELVIKLVANGTITAWQEAIVGAEVNGIRLSTVQVNVGDQVKRGQVMATFAPETVQAEWAQQRASVAEAEAAYAEARDNADRARTLDASGALSVQQINQYLTAAKTAEARLAAARAVANNAQIKLANTRVLAPDSGVVSARTATVGAVVQSGQELFRLIRNNRLEWRAEVTAAELDKVHIGQAVAVLTPSGKTIAGRVRMLAPTVDVQTRSTIVYVDLLMTGNGANHADSSNARAGMFAKGEFELGKSAALTLPRQAVVVRDGFSYVFAIKPATDAKTSTTSSTLNATESRVVQVKIKTGRRAGERVEITEGVTADQLIVGTGAGFLNDGDLVSVLANTAESTANTAKQTPASAGIPNQKASTKPAP